MTTKLLFKENIKYGAGAYKTSNVKVLTFNLFMYVRQQWIIWKRYWTESKYLFVRITYATNSIKSSM